jgi:HPt (histidine-containing phosphotransfer) domain-containing protein
MQTTSSFNIDLSYLQSVTGGDRNFEKMLLTNALADIQSNIGMLQSAWAKRDAITISSAAHTLKSVVAIAGLQQLSVLCKKVNLIFRDGVFRMEGEKTLSDIIEGWTKAKPKLEEVITAY